MSAKVNGVLPGSFRDPAGFLFRRDGTLYRQVNRSFAKQFESFVSCGLYDSLVEADLMIRHEEVDVEPAAPNAHKVLRPEEIGFISYPYEWSFGMLKDAALATLAIQKRAMDKGFSLRDASAYNIQFLRGRPLLIDTLSLEPLEQGKPWVAYRQYCQHFLGPLALMSYCDERLAQLSGDFIDGIPLDLTAKLLPRRTRYRPGLAMHIHFQSRVSARHAGASGKAGTPRKMLGPQAFKGLIDSLDTVTRRLRIQRRGSTWDAYYAECDHYSGEAFEHKKVLVTKHLDELAPDSVWDLGANTGLFSRLVSERDISVVSIESDPACVDVGYAESKQAGLRNVLPIVCDLTSPSPSIGWANQERMSLLERGPADCGLALAVIHHLAIANNVPLPRIAALMAAFARSLIIEFVPKSDPKAQLLLTTRQDIFPDYTREGFELAFGKYFKIERVDPILSTGRLLYLMRGMSIGSG